MKVFLTLLLVFNLALAEGNYELKLFEKVLTGIFGNHAIQIYVKDDDIKNMLEKSQIFALADRCDTNTSLLVGKDFKNLSKICQEKPVFTTNYRYYKSSPNVFGVFYWRKGRPQLKFKTKAIQIFHLNLPKYLNRYTQ